MLGIVAEIRYLIVEFFNMLIALSIIFGATQIFS